MKATVDILTVHFGRAGWTRKLVESCLCCLNDTDVELGIIHIVDNSRDGWICKELESLSCVQFHEFPVDASHMDYYKHDHGASLARACTLSDADILVILDCDAHLLQDGFLQYLAKTIVVEGHAAIAAPDARHPDSNLTHPCFLALSKAARANPLPFDSRLVSSEYYDVGRLIGKTLLDRGLSVHFPKRVRAFDGHWGEVFDGQVYHHGSGTFSHSKASEILKQVDKCAWMFERAVLQKKRLHLTPLEKWHLRFQTRLLWQF